MRSLECDRGTQSAQRHLVFPILRSLHSKWGRPPGRCELIEAVSAANGSRKKLRVCRPYKQSVGPRDTLHIPGICAPFSESRLVHIFPGLRGSPWTRRPSTNSNPIQESKPTRASAADRGVCPTSCRVSVRAPHLDLRRWTNVQTRVARANCRHTT